MFHLKNHFSDVFYHFLVFFVKVMEISGFFIQFIQFTQESQTHGPRATCSPREGPMRPANIRKNEDLKGRIDIIFLIFPIKLIFNTQFKYFIFMRPLRPMRTASPFEFETPELTDEFPRYFYLSDWD